jgi:tetratricopeptide (TPR) repeat protein
MLERERKIHLKISKKQTLQANLHLKKGNIAEAIDHYRMALKYGPANLEARIGLSECYIKKGEYDEAKKRLTYVFENQDVLKPTKRDIKRIYNDLLSIEQKIGDQKNQYKYCEMIEKMDKNDKSIEYKIIEVILGDNKPSLSKKTYEKILKKNKNNKAAMINLGDIHLKWKDFSKATEFYDKVLDRNFGNSILEIDGRAFIGLASINYLKFQETGNETFLKEANELAEKAINCERRALKDNKRIFFEAARIKSHYINNDSLKFHVVYKYLETAINLDLDYLDARSLRAKLILDNFSSPHQSQFYYRTAARDLMKIASLKPSEENVRKAYEVSSKIDWRSAERLKKQLDRIIFFKNRKKIFVAEVLDDMEERERIIFWNKTKNELQKIKEEDFSKNKTSIMKARSMIEKRIIKDLKGRNELSEEGGFHIHSSFNISK